MKKRELVKNLRTCGWYKYGEGKRHEKWTNGELKTTIPRHIEINEFTAKSILKLAKENKNGD